VVARVSGVAADDVGLDGTAAATAGRRAIVGVPIAGTGDRAGAAATFGTPSSLVFILVVWTSAAAVGGVVAPLAL
jgi:hypothetical protein